MPISAQFVSPSCHNLEAHNCLSCLNTCKAVGLQFSFNPTKKGPNDYAPVHKATSRADAEQDLEWIKP